MADDSVNIDIKGDSTSFVKASKQAQTSMGKTTAAANTMKLSTAGALAVVAGGNIAARGILSVASAFTEAFQEAVLFEKALIEIDTLLPATSKLTKDLKESLVDLSVEYGVDKTSQAKAYYQIVSAGVTDTAKAMKVLTAANTLAQAGLGDLGTAVLGITKVVNNYGDKAGDAANVSDILFQAVKNGQTTIDEFAGALPKVLSIADQLGVSFSVTSAALTTLTNKSENTAIAATELTALFSSLIKNQKVLSTTTDASGKSFSLQRLQVDGLLKFMQDLVVATKDVSGLQVALGGRIQSLNAALKFASGDFASLTKNIEDFSRSSGAAAEAADLVKESLDFKLEKAKKQTSTFFATFMRGITPVVKAALDLADAIYRIGRGDKGLEGANIKLSAALKKYESFSKIRNESDPFLAKLKKEVEEAKNLVKFYTLADELGAEDGADDGKAAEDAALKIKLAEAAAAAEVKEKQNLNDDLLALDEEYSIESTEKRQERIDTIAEIEQAEVDRKIADKAAELRSQGKFEDAKLLIIKESLKKEKKALETQNKVVELTQKEKKAILQSTLAQIATLQDSGNATAIAVGKAAGIANVIINTQVGASEAFKLGPIVGPPLAAAVIAAGALSASKIAGVQYADGGFVGGQASGARAGGDDQLASIKTGELILNAQDQKELLDTIRSGSLGGSGNGEETTINLSVNLDGKKIYKSTEKYVIAGRANGTSKI